MVQGRMAVGIRRALIENEILAAAAGFYGLFENAILFPKIGDLSLQLGRMIFFKIFKHRVRYEKYTLIQGKFQIINPRFQVNFAMFRVSDLSFRF